MGSSGFMSNPYILLTYHNNNKRSVNTMFDSVMDLDMAYQSSEQRNFG